MAKNELVVDISANIKDLVKAIEEAKKLIGDLSSTLSQGIKLAVDVKSIKSDIKSVKSDIKNELIAKPFKVIVETDGNKLKASIKSALREAIKEINTQGVGSKLKLPADHKFKVKVDTNSARTSIKNLQSMLSKHEIRINTSKAEGDIVRLSTYMNQLGAKKITPQIDMSKAEQAKLSITELATYMNQLQSKKIKIDIEFANKDIVNHLKSIDDLLKSIQKNSNIKLNVSGTGKANAQGGIQSQIQQYRTLRQEARHFALEAEKAWTAGNKQGFEQNRQNFLVAMKDLADFSRQLGNLSASREAGMYTNMLRSLQQTSPLYNDILNKIKQLKKEQKDFNNLIGEGNKKLTQGSGTPKQREGRVPGFMQGTVGAAAYAIHFLGRSSKGFGSFGEATAELISDFNSLGGTVSKTMIPIAALAGTVAITATAFTAAIKGVEFFGGLLKQIGQEVYNALKPGIDLYKQQTSAFFSFTASLMSNGVIGGQKLSDMPNGMDTAMGLSNKLLQRAQIDAEMSAFSLQDILASLQGTLPILMSKGMTMEQAYEINKGVAAVAKMIQLTPSQILQETRDLAQGSITSRGSQVANALGVTNADLQKFQGDAEGLFNFLMEKFKQYGELLQQFEDTAIGRFQQLQERWQTVARSMIDGMLPQFKGAFETLINETGKWVATSGTYINEFGERVKYEGIASLDALTGKWKDAQGEIINGFQQEDAIFELAEPFKEIQEMLPEIVTYLADMVDRIVAFIEEETGINDPIEIAKEIIIGIADGFETSVKLLVKLIGFVDEWSFVLFPVLNILRGITNLFIVLVTSAEQLGSELAVVADQVKEIYYGLKGDADGMYKARQERINDEAWRNRSAVNNMKAWDDLVFAKRWESLEDIIGKNVSEKLGFLGEAVRTSSEEGKYREKTTNTNMNNVKGVPKNTEDDKARKKATQEAQRELKARLAELKNALKDALDELKRILNKNKIAYEEGFMTLREYLQLDAQSSVDEAQMKLNEAQAEREAIVNALYENEDDRRRALAEVDRNIRIYTRELSDAKQASKEVSKAIADGMQSFSESLSNFNVDALIKNISKATNSGKGDTTTVNGTTTTTVATVDSSSLQQAADSLGADVEDLRLVAEKAIEMGVDPKLALAVAKTESNFNQSEISDAGAIGIMQLMPDTATSLGVNPYDKLQNVMGGLTYLKQMLDTFSNDITKALAGYNAGPQAVKDYGGVPPYAETQAYVDIVQDYKAQYFDNIDFSKSSSTITNAASDVVSSTLDNIGNLLVSAAVEEVNKGTPYVWGGITLGQGVDCSGLIYAVWQQLYGQAVAQLGKTFPRMADAQAVGMNNYGAFYTDSSKLQPGDLVFTQGLSPGEMGIGHVAMYVGDGKIIEASGSNKPVHYSNLSDKSGVVGFGDVRKYFEALGLTVDRNLVGGGSSGATTTTKGNAPNTQDKSHNVWKQQQEQIKEAESIFADAESPYLGQYKMAMYKAQQEQIRKEEKLRRDNLLSTDVLEDEIAKSKVIFNKNILDIKDKAIESLADFNSLTMDRNAESMAYKIVLGQEDFEEYLDHIYQIVNTVNESNDQWLGNQVKQLEDLALEYEAKGWISDAERVREEIRKFLQKPYEVAEKVIESINKQFDNIESKFSSIGMTELQRERGEEQIKAARAQALLNIYSSTLDMYVSEYEDNLDYIDKLTQEQSLLNEETEKYAKLQGEINQTKIRNSIIQQQADELNLQKEINEEILKYSTYLKKVQLTAKQALEDGLVTFLTDGINEAESLGEALRNLAVDFLKTMQQFFAKQIVTGLMNQWFPVPNKEGTRVSMEDLASRVDLTQIDEGSLVTANAVEVGTTRIVTAIESLKPSLGVFSNDWQSSQLNPNRQYTFNAKDYDLNNRFSRNIDSLNQTLQSNIDISKLNTQTSSSLVVATQANTTATQSQITATSTAMSQENINSIRKLQAENSNTLAVEDSTNATRENSSVTRDNTVQQRTNESSFVGSGLSGNFATSSVSSIPLGGQFGGIGASLGNSISNVVSPITNLVSTITNQVASFLNSPMFTSLLSSVTSITGSAGAQLGGSVLAIGAIAKGDKKEQLLGTIYLETQLLYVGQQQEIMLLSNIVAQLQTFVSGMGFAATGGLIKGPGTSTSDDIPAMLSNGEYVIKASSVKKYGTNFLSALNEGKLSKIKSRIPHFAEGGLIKDISQDGTARGVSNFGKSMASSINNTANISVALVRDEQEGMKQLLKSPEGQKIMLDFNRKYAKVSRKF